MESMTKRKPLYWINPNYRLNFPSFSVEWHLCDASDLELGMMYCKQKRLMYGVGTNSVHAIVRDDNSGLDLLYTDQTRYENMRLQKWLRETIRDHIVLRAKDGSVVIWKQFAVVGMAANYVSFLPLYSPIQIMRQGVSANEDKSIGSHT